MDHRLASTARNSCKSIEKRFLAGTAAVYCGQRYNGACSVRRGSVDQLHVALGGALHELVDDVALQLPHRLEQRAHRVVMFTEQLGQ